MTLRKSLLAAALLAATGFASATDATSAGVPTGPLPRNVVPSEVALELKIDPAQPRFSGHVRMDVDVATPTDTIWMHGRGLNITSARFLPAQGAPIGLKTEEADVSGVCSSE